MAEKIIMALIQSEWVQTAVIGLIVALIAKWYRSETGAKWKKYEGYAITAIKAAEKAIPDDTEHKGLMRLNKALILFCDKYKAATGVTPSESDMVQIENFINVVHAALEKDEAI